MIDKTINKTLLKQEHGEMDQLVVILLHVIAERKEPRQRVIGLLEKLRIRVMAHLDDDKPQWFLGRKTQNDMALACGCELLRQTHATLIDEFDHVMQLATKGEIQHDWWNKLEESFHRLCVTVGQYLLMDQKLLAKIDDNPL